MAKKTIQVKLSTSDHRQLKASAALSDERIPDHASRLISKAIEAKLVIKKED